VYLELFTLKYTHFCEDMIEDNT